MKEKPGDVAEVLDRIELDFEQQGEAQRATVHRLADRIAVEVVMAYLSHGARFRPNDWAARYMTLLAFVRNPRLAVAVETIASFTRVAHDVTGRPPNVILSRVLGFIAQLKFEGGVVYPNHAASCGVNTLGVFRECDCGEAERLVTQARLAAAEPGYGDGELLWIFEAVGDGAGDHGSFLMQFARNYIAGDRDNKSLLRASALALVARYGLARYLEGRGEV
jgi:hypothetical protein